MNRPYEAPLPDPLAYLLTWTTYGTWLPGDARGWVKPGRGIQLPDAKRELRSKSRMRESALRLDLRQRQLIEREIADRCATRGWTLYAVNCRTNHVHVVVHASQHPNIVRNDLKARCSYRLKAHALASTPSIGQRIPRNRFWTEGGSQRYLNSEDSLEAAVRYVRDAQDLPRV